MKWNGIGNGIFCIVLLALPCTLAQDAPARSDSANVTLHLNVASRGRHRAVPAVLWLQPMEGTAIIPFTSHTRYTLLQKDRMFTPHLLVVPVGSTVSFPNADPFFHNVFSLFDGKRFDLGLYEAGSSRQVVFSREGLSYIFCNIHPEMSAVVLVLSTPLFAVADKNGLFDLRNVPPGNYKMNVWIEGLPQARLTQMGRHLHLAAGSVDLGELSVTGAPENSTTHTNKFGQPYDSDPKSPY